VEDAGTAAEIELDAVQLHEDLEIGRRGMEEMTGMMLSLTDPVCVCAVGEGEVLVMEDLLYDDDNYPF
jgi:hypothetical protein